MSHSFGNNDWEEDADAGVSADQLLAQAKNRRQETLDVVRDSVSRMRQTEETAMHSMTKLSEQSEKLHRAQKELHSAASNERVAGEQVTEIKRLNRLFGFKNPFRNRTKEKAQKAALVEERQREKQRYGDQVQESLYRSQQRLAGAGGSSARGHPGAGGSSNRGHPGAGGSSTRGQSPSSGRRPQSNRHHYASAAIESDLLDEEDRQQETEIDQGLHDIAQVASNLKAMALGMNSELQHQNRHIATLANSSDDLKVRLNSTNDRMKRIK